MSISFLEKRHKNVDNILLDALKIEEYNLIIAAKEVEERLLILHECEKRAGQIKTALIALGVNVDIQN